MKTSFLFLTAWTAAALALLVGCGGPDAATSSAPAPAATVGAAPPPPLPAGPPAAPPATATTDLTASPAPAAEPATPEPAAAEEPDDSTAGDDLNRRKAEAGVGVRGRGYGGTVLTYPIHVKFTVDEMVVFQIKIPAAMKLYRAEKNRFPRDQEEFTRDIIEFNSIELPDLPPGDRYVYDPKTGELMVETPGPSPEEASDAPSSP